MFTLTEGTHAIKFLGHILVSFSCIPFLLKRKTFSRRWMTLYLFTYDNDAMAILALLVLFVSEIRLSFLYSVS